MLIRAVLIASHRLRLLFFLYYLINLSPCQIITGRPPQLSDFPRNYYSPLEGAEFSIKCPLSYENYQVEWFKDGESLGKTANALSIPSISRIDSGLYKCYAYNGIGGAYSKSVNVSVSCKFLNTVVKSGSLDFDGFKQVPDSFYKARVPANGYFSLRPPPLNASPNVKLSWKWKFEEQEVEVLF